LARRISSENAPIHKMNICTTYCANIARARASRVMSDPIYPRNPPRKARILIYLWRAENWHGPLENYLSTLYIYFAARRCSYTRLRRRNIGRNYCDWCIRWKLQEFTGKRATRGWNCRVFFYEVSRINISKVILRYANSIKFLRGAIIKYY